MKKQVSLSVISSPRPNLTSAPPMLRLYPQPVKRITPPMGSTVTIAQVMNTHANVSSVLLQNIEVRV